LLPYLKQEKRWFNDKVYTTVQITTRRRSRKLFQTFEIQLTYSVKQKWNAEYCKFISEVRDVLQSIAALSQARKTLVELLSTDSGQQREKTADGRRRGAGGQRSKKKRRTRDAEKKKKKGSVRGKTTGCEEKTADGRRPDEKK
jgi:hypothetical protein